MRNRAYPLYEVPSPKNFRELVEQANEKYGETVAFSWSEDGNLKSHTFAEFFSDVRALATKFLSMGYSNDTKIAVIGKNSYDWVVVYFATVCAGNIIVPLDKELDAKTIKALLKNSDTKLAVYDDEYEDIFKKFLKPKTASMKDELPALIEDGKKLLANGNKLYDAVSITNFATSTIIYTSGTTGEPKGVELSQGSLMASGVHARELGKIGGSTLLVLPLHHTYPFCACIVVPLIVGATVHINSNLKNVGDDIKTGAPQYICAVPLLAESLYKKIWLNAKKTGKDKILKKMIKVSDGFLKVGVDVRRKLFKSIIDGFGGNLEILVCGGAPMPKYLFAAFFSLGIFVIEGYGITECSPVVSLNRNHHWKVGSVGLVCKNNEVRIIDKGEDGHGEICVRGDLVMNGYYKNPKETAKVMDGEWFATGDIGYVDDDGFIFITGRKKILIIRGNGKNVHPEELEELVGGIDGVLEVVVTGDHKSIYAEIFMDPDKPEILQEYIEKGIKELNKTLPFWKRINKATFRSTEFEKTTTKKIKRW